MNELQFNSRDCFACGLANKIGLKMRFYNTGPGEVSSDYVVTDQYQGYPGVVHGGIVAAMLDEISARALMGNTPPRFMYTAKLNIRYRKNVPIGVPLHLVGKAGKFRKRSATSVGAIYGSDGDLLAEAEALLIDIPEDIFNSVDLDKLGWKIYKNDYASSEYE